MNIGIPVRVIVRARISISIRSRVIVRARVGIGISYFMGKGKILYYM